MQLQDLTIVVPTRNEAANIGTFLESLPAEAALIVVDRSTDGTANLVRRSGRGTRPSSTARSR